VLQHSNTPLRNKPNGTIHGELVIFLLIEAQNYEFALKFWQDQTDKRG
jgi:hypothetical protein